MGLHRFLIIYVFIFKREWYGQLDAIRFFDYNVADRSVNITIYDTDRINLYSSHETSSLNN